ncbi:MAG: hypothetical protein NVS2B7_03880 [Herpetosiphon sp.]
MDVIPGLLRGAVVRDVQGVWYDDKAMMLTNPGQIGENLGEGDAEQARLGLKIAQEQDENCLERPIGPGRQEHGFRRRQREIDLTVLVGERGPFIQGGPIRRIEEAEAIRA